MKAKLKNTLPLWKQLTIGKIEQNTLRKDVETNVATSRLAEAMIATIIFLNTEETISLYIVTPRQLGFRSNDLLSPKKIYARAKKCTLELCPPEVAFTTTGHGVEQIAPIH